MTPDFPYEGWEYPPLLAGRQRAQTNVDPSAGLWRTAPMKVRGQSPARQERNGGTHVKSQASESALQ
jgi:hypothetical protein